MSDPERVYAVHTARPDEIGAVEIVFGDEAAARAYAKSRSKDARVLSASVTSYLIAQLGTRHPLAWYQDGEEQDVRAKRPGDYYPTDFPVEIAQTRMRGRSSS